MKHFGDITKLSGYDLPIVDIITGGSPCQNLSQAGNRKGLDGEESKLFFEQIRIIKEMRERDRSTGRTGFFVRPRYAVWENVQGALTSNRGVTSRKSSRSSSGSSSRTAPMCLCLKTVGGLNPGVSMMKWDDGLLLGDFTTHSFGESPREENGSRLSQILEDEAPQKYYLSARACAGILRRAEKRKKELPPELKAALEAQSVSKNEPVNQGGGKGILIQGERTGALSTLNNQRVYDGRKDI